MIEARASKLNMIIANTFVGAFGKMKHYTQLGSAFWARLLLDSKPELRHSSQSPLEILKLDTLTIHEVSQN